MGNKNVVISEISKIRKASFDYIEEELKKRKIEGLVISHGNILDILYENNGKLTMKEISKGINRSKSTVTQLVEKLIKSGYVIKKVSEEDKRYSYIELTEKGVNIKDHFREISKNLIKKFFEDFTSEEEKILMELLSKIVNNFE